MFSYPIQTVTSNLLHESPCFLSTFPSFPGFPLFLSNPEELFVAHTKDEVAPVLRQAETAAQSGSWVGGYLSYEAAGAFDLPVCPPESHTPLVWMARFASACRAILPCPNGSVAFHGPLEMEGNPAHYRKCLEEILKAIATGESYQVNHTVMAILKERLDPGSLFLALQGLHRFPYAAWVNDGQGVTASFSPELFFDLHEGTITTAPIKGTRPRSSEVREDDRLAKILKNSPKDRAEHLMIVDMARNDLGKICSPGTIEVPHLFGRRSYSTIHHLETSVRGKLSSGVGLAEIMDAMFPAASITGAPKRRAMEIICQQEKRPRGIYTGAIGLLGRGRMTFNVAIRTVSWRGANWGRMGLGGGIVADSMVDKEWREITDKGRFLKDAPEPFCLIETFMVDKMGRIPLEKEHVARLIHSAAVLGIHCPEREALSKSMQKWAAGKVGRCRMLRLLLNMAGDVEIQERPYVPRFSSLRVCVAPIRVDGQAFERQHKTTRREVFDVCLKEAREGGFEDCLFLNDRDRVTEGAIRAVVVQLVGGDWVAPPLQDGVLPSIWRKEFMRRHRVREEGLTLDTLRQAREIWMGNAVTGGIPVVWIEDVGGEVVYHAPNLRRDK